MDRVTRIDLAGGRLSKARRSPSGAAIVPAAITRTGVLTYHNPDGSERREWRPPEEVFHEDSLASLVGAPVTDLHPNGLVTPATYRFHAAGSVASPARADGQEVVTELAIHDQGLLQGIDSGDREQVSCGYECALDWTSGVTPEGERYDAIQRVITYNHVAIVPKGRAGSGVSLRLDSDGNQVMSQPTPQASATPAPEQVRIVRVDGVDYLLDSPEHKAAEAFSKRLDALEAERDSHKAKAEALQASIPALVAARVALETKARSHGVEVRADASDEELETALLAKLAPTIKLDGKSEDYRRAALEVALSSVQATDTVRADAHRASQGEGERLDASAPAPDQVARERMSRKARGLPTN